MDADVACYIADIEVGHYLRAHRLKLQLTVHQVRARTRIPTLRILELEEARGDRSITKSEAKALSIVYGVSLDEILMLALGETRDLCFN